MKIVFLSNYFNHHQSPFCHAMYNRLGESFCFVQTEEMEEERIQMGWGLDKEPPFVKKIYADQFTEKECKKCIEEADVVILGTAPEYLVRNRLRSGKLVVRYGERQLKKGLELWKYPYRYLKWHRLNPRYAKLTLLCASAYAASDYAKFGLFINQCYKWGYFPEMRKFADIDRLLKSKRPASILWVARLIEWKHPELAIYIAKRLKDDGYVFEMSLIGNGVLETQLRDLINEYEVADCVKMLGAMKPEQVREHMEQSRIFLFTSDRHEGWGAVLNEAMNSACAVVANRAIGAAPFLITNNENGLMYADKDIEDLYVKVKNLLENSEKAEQLGKNAYETIIREWNADVAAERLLLLLEDLQKHKCSNRYSQGPCSKAEILSDK